MTTKLYHHKTDGGAEYLTDTFISWKHNGKSGKEGTVTLDTKICVRLDGQPELTGTIEQDRAALLAELENASVVLEYVRDGKKISPAALVNLLDRIYAVIARVS